MVLITRDKGMKVRAEALGVDVALWTGPEESETAPCGAKWRPSTAGQLGVSAAIWRLGERPEAFRDMHVACQEADAPLRVGKIPEAGDRVRLGGGHEFHLGALISAGGERSIYETQLAGQVSRSTTATGSQT
jgi:hypothetical protein